MPSTGDGGRRGAAGGGGNAGVVRAAIEDDGVARLSGFDVGGECRIVAGRDIIDGGVQGHWQEQNQRANQPATRVKSIRSASGHAWLPPKLRYW